MPRGDTSLASHEYDDYLAGNGKTRELRQRQAERRNANKGYNGWHFGIGDRPVHTKDKVGFRKALKDRGLMMRDDVRRPLK